MVLIGSRQELRVTQAFCENFLSYFESNLVVDACLSNGCPGWHFNRYAGRGRTVTDYLA
jgi:hypothetical protein